MAVLSFSQNLIDAAQPVAAADAQPAAAELKRLDHTLFTPVTGFFSSIKSKVVRTFIGDLVADLGTLPIDEYGREISLSIRRRPGKPAHLQVKLASNEETNYFQITRIRCVSYAERIRFALWRRTPDFQCRNNPR
jgi:hypothetical protein